VELALSGTIHNTKIMNNKTSYILISSIVFVCSLCSAPAHPVVVHEQITSKAVDYAQLYSKGYTNFINTISVPSAFVPVGPYLPLSVLFVQQSPKAFNTELVYTGFIKGVKPEWRLDKGTFFSVFAAVLHFFHEVTWTI
jgi:hypothetical protein